MSKAMKFVDSIVIDTELRCYICGAIPQETERIETLDREFHILQIECFSHLIERVEQKEPIERDCGD